MEKSHASDMAATAPRIVNGLTVRTREKTEPSLLWLCGIGLLPDFLVLLVLVCFCIKWWPQHLDKRRTDNRYFGP